MAERSGSRPAPFPWTGDAGRGAWIAERLGDVVPGGFAALIRVLHPFQRDLPVRGTWQDYRRLQAEFAAASARGEPVDWGGLPEIRDEPVTWAATAAAHGTDPAPTSLSFRLLGFERYGQQPDGTEINPDGRRYQLPAEGRLETGALAAVARVLAAHTATPGDGVAAVWEGYAGLVSSQGIAYFGWAGPPRRPLPGWAERLRQRLWSTTLHFRMTRRRFGLRSAARSQLLRGDEQPAGTGLLPRAAAEGPRLELPDRAYICFEAGIADFADEGWIERAPWVERRWPGDDAQSPNLIWPEDRAWILISEIDFDSTLIACSRPCADALLAAPGVEAVEIDRDTPLWAVGD